MLENELINLINNDLRGLIITTFNIDDDSILSTTQLTNGGISLDSMQVILLISAIEEHFSIRMNTNILVGNSFKNIETISLFLFQNHGNQLIGKYLM